MILGLHHNQLDSTHESIFTEVVRCGGSREGKGNTPMREESLGNHTPTSSLWGRDCPKRGTDLSTFIWTFGLQKLSWSMVTIFP